MSLWPASASAERHVSEHRTVKANCRLVSRPSCLVAARRKEPGVSASSRAVTGLCYPVQHRTRLSTNVRKTSTSDDQQGLPPWRIPHLVSELKVKPQAKRQRPLWEGRVWDITRIKSAQVNAASCCRRERQLDALPNGATSRKTLTFEDCEESWAFCSELQLL